MAWNRPSAANQQPAQKSGSKAPSAMRGVIAGAVVVVLGALCFFIFSGKETRQDAAPTQERGKIKEVTPAAAPKYKEEPKKEEPKEDPERAKRKAMLAKMTPEERIEFRFKEMERKPYDLDSSKGKAYRNGLEQVMSWMFTVDLGDMPPVLPEISIQDEAHLVAILFSPNEITDKDSEEVARAKEAVEVAKKELIKYIKQGGDVHSFLEYYHNELKQAHDEFEFAHQKVKSMAREDPEIAVEYFNKVNAKLKERGIKTVKPNKALMRLAEEQGVELIYDHNEKAAEKTAETK